MANGHKRTDEKDAKLYVYLIISQNKDNKDVLGFKERRRSFVTKEGSLRPAREFKYFLREALPGETCRMYRSVNARDPEKVKQALLVHLITEPGASARLDQMDSTLASIAAKKECAAQKHWLFDFNTKDPEVVCAFTEDLNKYSGQADTTAWFPTPNGYAVVVDHGFDTRELLAKYEDVVSLKRDDVRLVAATKVDEKSGIAVDLVLERSISKRS